MYVPSMFNMLLPWPPFESEEFCEMSQIDMRYKPRPVISKNLFRFLLLMLNLWFKYQT